MSATSHAQQRTTARIERGRLRDRARSRSGLSATTSANVPDAESWSVPLTLPWWSSPAGLCVGFLMPVIFIIALAGGADHPGVTVRGLIFLDGPMLALAAYMMVVMGIGGWLGAQLRVARIPVSSAMPSQKYWDTAALVIGLIALAAYCLWFQNYVFNPVLLWQTITGEHKPGRDSITLMPGFTSYANFGPPFFAIVIFRWLFQSPGEKMSRPLVVLACILAVFTVFRVYAWSERLSLIEASAPLSLPLGARICVWASAARTSIFSHLIEKKNTGIGRPRRGVRHVMWPQIAILFRVAGPYAAIPFVIVLFGVFEYFRSWDFGPYRGKMDFWDFAIGRFISYYYTSLNNGAGLFKSSDAPTWGLNYVFEWVYKGPWSPGAPIFYRGSPSLDFDHFLSMYGDPEFNSPSGVYAILSDLGYVVGTIYVLVVGFMAGLLFRAYREGAFFGVVLYPSMLVMFSEIFRYPYLGTSRAFTIFVGSVLSLLVLSMTSRFARISRKA